MQTSQLLTSVNHSQNSITCTIAVGMKRKMTNSSDQLHISSMDTLLCTVSYVEHFYSPYQKQMVYTLLCMGIHVYRPYQKQMVYTLLCMGIHVYRPYQKQMVYTLLCMGIHVYRPYQKQMVYTLLCMGIHV